MIALTLNGSGTRETGTRWTSNTTWGYEQEDNDDIRWEKNRGSWSLNQENARKHDLVLVIHKDHVVAVWNIVDVAPSGMLDGRGKTEYYFRGRPFYPGEPMYERFIGTNMKGTRNPIRYLPDPE